MLAIGNGQLNFEIVFHGQAVHSSRPEDGRNAIHDAAAFIRLVEDESAHLAGAPFPGIGPATYSVGLVEGGRGGSTVADRCQITLDRRVLPIREPGSRRGNKYSAFWPGWRASARACDGSWRGPSPSRPCEAPTRGTWRRPSTAPCPTWARSSPMSAPGMRFATDAAWYEAAGCPAVVFGPGDVTLAHQPDEHVAISDLYAATRAIALCCGRLLAPGGPRRPLPGLVGARPA